MTADEPMSTPDSGGLREAWAHVVRDHDMPPNKDSHAYGYRMGWWDAVVYLDKILTRGLRSCDDCPGPLAAHPEPVSTPDSADDATVGERECPTCGICSCSAAFGYHRRMAECATPPADDANRAPVGGGLDEGEREALSTMERHRLAACWNDANGNHQPARWDEVLHHVERILAGRHTAWVERLAAVKRERDEWVERLVATEAERNEWKTTASRTRQWALDELAKSDAALEAAEAERDTARREAGERIAVAIEDLPAYYVQRGEGGGWLHAVLTSAAVRIARADALTSDDGSGA